MRDGDTPWQAGDEPALPRLPAGVDLARAGWWDAPDPAIEDALMRAVAEQPTRRFRFAAVAAVGIAAAVALVFAGYLWGDREPPLRGTEFALAATGLQPAAAAGGRIDETPNGTWIRLEVASLAPAGPGEYYEAWLADGAEIVSAGTFHMRGEPAPVVLWAGVSPAAYPELIVTLQAEGEWTPSDRVVLRGKVAP
jgi:hypothetical protein